jgi:hypothetical protein
MTGHVMTGSEAPRSMLCQTFDHEPVSFHASREGASRSKCVGASRGRTS